MADVNKFRFSVDRGGTFTDVYAEVPGEPGFRVAKLLSEDPQNYADAPREGIRRILKEVTGKQMPKDNFDSHMIEWIRMGTTVATNALLELDRTIWQAQQDLENAEFIIQARDTLRELIAILGTRLAAAPVSETDCLAPIVEQLLEVRETFRQRKQFEEADAVRNCLQRANIVIEDEKEGSRWRLSS